MALSCLLIKHYYGHPQSSSESFWSAIGRKNSSTLLKEYHIMLIGHKPTELTSKSEEVPKNRPILTVKKVNRDQAQFFIVCPQFWDLFYADFSGGSKKPSWPKSFQKGIFISFKSPNPAFVIRKTCGQIGSTSCRLTKVFSHSCSSESKASALKKRTENLHFIHSTRLPSCWHLNSDSEIQNGKRS